MADQIIGKDVVAYFIAPGGVDVGTNVPIQGSSLTALGKWSDIEITYMTDFFETTPSDGKIKQRRAGPNDWKATLTNQVRADIGSTAMTVALLNNWVYFSFTEALSGKTMYCVGGIPEASMNAGKEGWSDKLEVICVGYYPTYG